MTAQEVYGERWHRVATDIVKRSFNFFREQDAVFLFEFFYSICRQPRRLKYPTQKSDRSETARVS
ncbi:MAG: hypothetical protein AB1742_10260, partial [bacterium]